MRALYNYGRAGAVLALADMFGGPEPVREYRYREERPEPLPAHAEPGRRAPKPERVPTDADALRIHLAETKRARKATKLKERGHL